MYVRYFTYLCIEVMPQGCGYPLEIGPFAEGNAEYKSRPYGPKTADSANSTQSQNERYGNTYPVKFDYTNGLVMPVW